MINSQLRCKIIFFATKNIGKFNEARKLMSKHGMAIALLKAKTYEMQCDSLEEIARASVMEAFERYRLPLMVEDAGLFVSALNGFPGPYSSYVYRTIGNEYLLKIMKDVENRRAEFRSAVAFLSENVNSPQIFKGKCVGEITLEERGSDSGQGFGFDPIFSPANCSKTFSQMTTMEKNRYSHRAQALRRFARWYTRAR